MKEFFKNIKKGITISFGFIIGIVLLGTIYVFASGLTATTGETLTAQKWNDLVAKFTNCTVFQHSTSEALTGERWIDGKPIYKIVVNAGSIPNPSSSKDIAIPSYNTSNYYWIESAFTYRSSDSQRLSIPYNNSVAVLNIALIGSNIRLLSGTNDLSTFTDTKVILKYTKSTDTLLSSVSNICP